VNSKDPQKIRERYLGDLDLVFSAVSAVKRFS
jgi:hypothetical protein